MTASVTAFSERGTSSTRRRYAARRSSIELLSSSSVSVTLDNWLRWLIWNHMLQIIQSSQATVSFQNSDDLLCGDLVGRDFYHICIEVWASRSARKRLDGSETSSLRCALASTALRRSIFVYSEMERDSSTPSRICSGWL